MSGRPGESEEWVSDWVEKAELDFRAAEYLLTMGRRCPFGIVCYHAQQCVEKYIKALLVHMGVSFPWTHDIGDLVSLLPAGTDIPLDEREQELLTAYAALSRYPGPLEAPGPERAEEAVKLARRVRRAIRKALSTRKTAKGA
ncbi:MAG: HEPN domain-containing protein [Euryarchaeota archaeon]|nr:HEPN domain-containing protein [Euryarchaeota archaeon]